VASAAGTGVYGYAPSAGVGVVGETGTTGYALQAIVGTGGVGLQVEVPGGGETTGVRINIWNGVPIEITQTNHRGFMNVPICADNVPPTARANGDVWFELDGIFPKLWIRSAGVDYPLF
jgi:hypothetical protein